MKGLWRKPPTEAPGLPADIEEIRQRALKGHVLEQVLWGKVLLNSSYVPADPASACSWFTIAANAHYGPAYNMLGRCSHFGWGCTQDVGQAADHYRRAAELGDEWGRYNLGILYMRGIGVDRNLLTALKLFEQAARAGHAKSMNLYARFLEEGWEIRQNRKEALLWYERSAWGGDYRGQHNYATYLLEAGEHDEALDWWEQAVVTATPDILSAMERVLGSIDGERAKALLSSVKSLKNGLTQG